MKPMLRGIAVAVAAVGVVACVAQQWTVRYSARENQYIYSQTLVAGPDGRSYVTGITDPEILVEGGEELFVASFDRNGKLLWDWLLPGGAYNTANLAIGKVLAVDAVGNSYLAWGDLDLDELRLYKLDPDGQLIGEWLALSGAFAWADDLQIGPDQNLYLSTGGGDVVQAYTPNGELLWQVVLPTPELPDHNLSPYPGLVAGGGVSVASAALGRSRRGGVLRFLSDGKILQLNPSLLRLLDTSGHVLASLEASALGADAFGQVAVVEDQVMVATLTELGNEMQIELVRLDGMLMELDRTMVAEDTGRVFMASFGSTVCVVTSPQYLELRAGAYQVFQFDSSGALRAMTEQPVEKFSYWLIEGVVGYDTGCAVSEISIDQRTKSRITHFDVSGKVGDIIQTRNFDLGDFLVSGKDTIQVGFTDELTEIVLSKHRRY